MTHEQSTVILGTEVAPDNVPLGVPKNAASHGRL